MVDNIEGPRPPEPHTPRELLNAAKEISSQSYKIYAATRTFLEEAQLTGPQKEQVVQEYLRQAEPLAKKWLQLTNKAHRKMGFSKLREGVKPYKGWLASRKNAQIPELADRKERLAASVELVKEHAEELRSLQPRR